MIIILCSYLVYLYYVFFFFSSRRRHTRYWRDWSSDVCSSDLDWSKRFRNLSWKTDLSKRNEKEGRNSYRVCEWTGSYFCGRMYFAGTSSYGSRKRRFECYRKIGRSHEGVCRSCFQLCKIKLGTLCSF